MSDTSLAFRVTSAALFQEEIRDNQSNGQTASANTLYVYAADHDVRRIADVLTRHQIPHAINHYAIGDPADKTLCFYKRSELNSRQLDFLVDAASAGAQGRSLAGLP